MIFAIAGPFAQPQRRHARVRARRLPVHRHGRRRQRRRPGQSRAEPAPLLGKMLRIDVDDGDGTLRGIPPSNPFVGGAAAAARSGRSACAIRGAGASIAPTGDLYIGDVGQGSWEEIDCQAARRTPAARTTGGAASKARIAFDTSRTCTQGTLPDRSSSTTTVRLMLGDRRLRVSRRGHSEPGRRVRVQRLLLGPHLDADAVRVDVDVDAADRIRRYNVASFAQDRNGELYVIDITGGTVYRVNDGSAPTSTPTRTPTNTAVPAATSTFTPTPTRTPTPIPSTNTPTPTSTPIRWRRSDERHRHLRRSRRPEPAAQRASTRPG